MLSISSRSFVKNSFNKSTESTESDSSESPATNGKLIYKGSTFQPNNAKGSLKEFNKIENNLVSGKFSSTTNINNYKYTSLRKTGSQVFESEMTASTDGSSDNESTDYQTPLMSESVENTCNNNTFKKVSQFLTCTQGPNFTPSQAQASATVDKAKPKKKTRRGGKKARLRRERAAQLEAANKTPEIKVENEKTKIKYKTELCKNWIETGRCSYSVRCMFAHGHHELVSSQAEQNTKVAYKKTMCEKFHKENYCSYGSRCIYIHDERSLDVLPQSFYGKSLLLLGERLSQPDAYSTRLPVFENLTSMSASCEFSEEINSDEENLPSVSSDKKAPKDECYSYASDSTEVADEETSELLSIVEGVF